MSESTKFQIRISANIHSASGSILIVDFGANIVQFEFDLFCKQLWVGLLFIPNMEVAKSL